MPSKEDTVFRLLCVERSLDDLGLPGPRLPRLPGTRREAAGIVPLVSEGERMQVFDFDASRATLNSPEISQYRIIHLATHGLLDTASGIIRSRLVTDRPAGGKGGT